LKSPVALNSLPSTSASWLPTSLFHQPAELAWLVKSITATVMVGASRASSAPLAPSAKASAVLMMVARYAGFMSSPPG